MGEEANKVFDDKLLEHPVLFYRLILIRKFTALLYFVGIVVADERLGSMQRQALLMPTGR
jgi:hypothetical protein